MEGQIQKNIKDCRDALVGKVPNPIEQVQQITLALIYKFMSDLDQQSLNIGGNTTYFNDTYSKYSWQELMNPKLQFQEKYNLYSEGLEKLKTHPKLTDVFRKVFKDAYLPYKDPATLVNFLTLINKFSYNDSEILGEAFESLLNIMGSQGDAGQFRTPRHIIDFIIEIMKPNKNDKILDPACGTAGFLISAFNHITKSILTPQEKQDLTDNIIGYDIAPIMSEISAVNLYLHGFKNPQIFEYDTLTSTDKWKEKFDIILANPPFMTPKGGIKPHNLFEIKANRAEVLFSEYIIEHLKSTGRSGFIVPEGIIFKSETAYKTLRKNLISNGLYCVVSLPSGIFQPYSGVKTSIIFIDKTIKTNNILFINIKNDGFNLGAQRKPIKENDLPKAIEIIEEFKQQTLNNNLEEFKNKHTNDKNISVIEVEEIAKGGDYNLSANRYAKDEIRDCDWEMVELGEVCEEIKNGKNVNQFDEEGKYRVSRIETISKGNIDIKRIKWTNDDVPENIFLKQGDILLTHINSFEHLGKTGLYDNINEKIIHGINLIKLRPNKNIISYKYLYNYLKSNYFLDKFKSFAQKAVNQSSVRISDLSTIKIPLPPLEIQQEIVAKIEEEQKYIDGCKKLIEIHQEKIKDVIGKIMGK